MCANMYKTCKQVFDMCANMYLTCLQTCEHVFDMRTCIRHAIMSLMYELVFDCKHVFDLQSCVRFVNMYLACAHVFHMYNFFTCSGIVHAHAFIADVYVSSVIIR